MDSKLLFVKVTHDYNPVNNDELLLRVGDVITITNKDDGGWWEGTLQDKTGWFPSNYVVEYNCSVVVSETHDEYFNAVLNHFVESETAHVNQLGEFHSKLKLIATGLPQDICTSLLGNYGNVLAVHTEFLSALNQSDAVGKTFLNFGRRIESVLVKYCSHHPAVLQAIDKTEHSVVVGLSLPFMRVEKYPGVITELHRNVLTHHHDKGNLQRGICVYNCIQTRLVNVRKQKEMELEVLTPGGIQDFEGAELSTLGEVLLMSFMAIGKDKLPRYFVLFSNTILLLGYDNHTFVFKGRVPVSGINLTSIGACGFEISGPTIHMMEVECVDKETRDAWVGKISELLRASRYAYSTCSTNSTVPQVVQRRQRPKLVRQNAFDLDDEPNCFGSLYPPVRAWNINFLRPSPPFNGFRKAYASDISNAQDFQILSFVDSFAAKDYVTRSVHPLVVRESVGELVGSLRNEMRNLSTRLGNLTRQLDGEASARENILSILSRLQ